MKFNKTVLANYIVLNWYDLVSEIEYPDELEVRFINNFSGSLVRFLVSLKDSNQDDIVSVYLDGYNRLGCYANPEDIDFNKVNPDVAYWEGYKIKDDVLRYGFYETDELFKDILEELKGRTRTLTIVKELTVEEVKTKTKNKRYK